MQKVRESNFDLLRICSTFAVVMIHVSGRFLQFDGTTKIPANCTFPVMMLNHIVRFAVPCFFMLSGAFILADERNADYKYFYKKEFKNIGITGVVFCLLYVLYRMAKLGLSVFILDKHPVDTFFPSLVAILKDLIKGQPYFHLWYLFTLAGLYLAAPFVIRLAADLKRGGVNLYGKITTIFLVLASVSYITSDHKLMWDTGWQFCFISFFLMGYKIRQWGKGRKDNRVALLLVSAGLAINAVLAYINYLRGLNGMPVDVIQFRQNPFSNAALAPIEVTASCLTFAGFAVMDVKKGCAKLAGYMFLIYLFHAGIWDVIATVIGSRLIGNQVVEAVSVIFISIAVFLISLLSAIIYKSITHAGHSLVGERN